MMHPADAYLVWIGLTYLGALLAKITFWRIYWNEFSDSWLASWLATWLVFQQDDLGNWYFQIKPSDMLPVQQVWDLLLLGVHASITFYYGNWVNRMEDEADLVYLVPYMLTIPIIGIIGQIKGMNYTINPEGLKSPSLPVKISLTGLCGLFVGLLWYHCQLAVAEGMIGYYLMGTFGIPMVYYGAYIYVKTRGMRPYWHFHYWFIGWYFSTMYRFDTVVSKVFSAILYGVFVQGTMLCGLSPVLSQPTEIAKIELNFEEDDFQEKSNYQKMLEAEAALASAENKTEQV